MSRSFSIGDAIVKAFGVLWGTKSTDSTQGETVDVTGGAAHVLDQSVRLGENTAVGGQVVLDHCQYTKLTASGSGKGVAGTPGWLVGAICIAGTSPSIQVRNNSSAAGDVVLPTTVMTVGQILTLPKPIECPLGIYAELGGTTPQFNLLYR